eukprot:c2127_g1_i1.p1 GENE.c2127_g1_i1~~c2127_g1_i1.p1  ORF type:complete len:308 (+),score=57.92 c2127_g1_i1:42-926(+)
MEETWKDHRAQCFLELSREYQELYHADDIDRVYCLSVTDFLRDYVAQNKPVVIEGGAESWPAIQSWKSREYLREKLGQDLVSVDMTPTGYADAIVGDLFVTPATVKMPFSDFLDRIDPNHPSYVPPSEVVHYISHQNSSLNLEFQQLLDDVESSVHLGHDAFGAEPDAVNIWMGQDEAVTSLHKDHYENMYVMISGTKTFTLIPPVSYPFLYESTYTLASYVVDPLRTSHPKGYPLHHSHLSVSVSDPPQQVPWISVDPLKPGDLLVYFYACTKICIALQLVFLFVSFFSVRFI